MEPSSFRAGNPPAHRLRKTDRQFTKELSSPNDGNTLRPVGQEMEPSSSRAGSLSAHRLQRAQSRAFTKELSPPNGGNTMRSVGQEMARMEAHLRTLCADLKALENENASLRGQIRNCIHHMPEAGVHLDISSSEPAGVDVERKAFSMQEAAMEKLNSVSPGHYFEVDALLASVESGAIAPLRGQWLVALHESGGRLERRQDLPAEAFWTADELRQVATMLGDNFGLLFVAVSYRWLESSHPDPEGFHLSIIATVAKLYLGEAGKRGFPPDFKSQLAAACKLVGVSPDFAVFWVSFGGPRLLSFPPTLEPERPLTHADAALV